MLNARVLINKVMMSCIRLDSHVSNPSISANSMHKGEGAGGGWCAPSQAFLPWCNLANAGVS